MGNPNPHMNPDQNEQESNLRKPVVYTFDPPNTVSRLLKKIKGDVAVGLNMDEVGYEDDKRAAYNQLSREIKKRRAREIDFDQCVIWAGDILEKNSKDLQVAIWLCIASLWSEGGNETEKLRGFRDGIAVLKGLMDRFGPSLYPVDPKLKTRLLEEFDNSVRLKRLEDIETQQKREHFQVTDELLADFLDIKMPVAIRNDVQKSLLGEQIEGLDVFTRRLGVDAFERYQPDDDQLAKLLGAGLIEEATRDQAIAYYMDYITSAARLPLDYPQIEFCVSNYTIAHLRRHELPSVLETEIEKYKDVSAVKEDIFKGKLERLFRVLNRELESEEADHYCRLIVDLSNQNRWLFLEIRHLLNELKGVLAEQLGEEAPTFKVLEDRINQRAAETEAMIEEKEEQEATKQEGLKAKIEDLENRIQEYELKIASLKSENLLLARENEHLKAAEVQVPEAEHRPSSNGVSELKGTEGAAMELQDSIEKVDVADE